MRANLTDIPTASGLGAILLWSTTFAIARSVSEQVGPLTAGAATYLLGGILCLGQGVWRKPGGATRELSWSYKVGCGSLFTFYSAALYVAVGLANDRAQLVEIALVNYLWPALTVLCSIPLLGKKANGWLGPGTAVALIGLLLVMTQGTHLSWPGFQQHLRSNPAAYGLALAAAISWALYSNLARRWSTPGSGGAVEWFMLATGFVLLVLRMAAGEASRWNVRSIIELAALAGITATAYALWDVAMRRGNLLLVAVCSYFTPLLSTVVSCVYLRVSPGPQLWAGCLLLVTGSLLSWLSVSEPPVAPAEKAPQTEAARDDPFVR